MSPGGILIADTGNNRIRLINRTAVVSAPNPTTVTASPTFDFASTDTPPPLLTSILFMSASFLQSCTERHSSVVR